MDWTSQWNGYQMHCKHENEKNKPDYTGLKPVDYSYVLFLTFFCVFLLFCYIPLLPMATMLSFLQTFPDDRGVKIKIN